MFGFAIDDHLELRLLQQHHATELFALTEANRAHLRAWLPWLDATTTEQDSMDFIVMSLFTFAQSGAMVCGMFCDGVLCGVVGYNKVDWERSEATLGYWVGGAFEGRGLVTASVRAMLDHAFGRYGLDRVILAAATGNARSQAIADRLGFVRTEVRVDAEWLYDHHVDHQVNVMDRARWEQHPGRD